MRKSKDEVLGAIQAMIGPVGHLSNPNATDPFKRSIYSALMYIYDAATEEAPINTPNVAEQQSVDLTEIHKALEDLKEEIKAMKDRREIFEGKVKRIETSLKSATPPK